MNLAPPKVKEKVGHGSRASMRAKNLLGMLNRMSPGVFLEDEHILLNCQTVTDCSIVISKVAKCICINYLLGENAIVIVSGANLTLCPKEVQEAMSLVATAKVVVCQLEISSETTLAALKMARELGGKYT